MAKIAHESDSPEPSKNKPQRAVGESKSGDHDARPEQDPVEGSREVVERELKRESLPEASDDESERARKRVEEESNSPRRGSA